jgi:hypothetical protein
MPLLDLDYSEEQTTPPKKPDYFSRGLFLLGIVLFIGGLGYYIFLRFTQKPAPPPNNIIYSSDHLTDEEILGSIETEFNHNTGTASQNLGIIDDSTISAKNMLE